MAIIKLKLPRRHIIDLTGPEGNAFVLLGIAKKYADALSLDWTPISAEMRSGDYEHLITTFDKYFGAHVDLAR
jgi:hypothetical protein